MTPDFKKSFFVSSTAKKNFPETMAAEKIHGNVSINNFPQSSIGIKRATTPLIRSCQEIPYQVLGAGHTNGREKSEVNTKKLLNRASKREEECELDKTPPLLNADLEVDFSRNFERARQIHKSYIESLSSFKSEKNSSFNDSSKLIKTTFEESGRTSIYLSPPNEKSSRKYENLKTLNFGRDFLASPKRNQFSFNRERGIETDRTYKTDDRKERQNTHNPTSLKNQYLNSVTSSVSNMSLKTDATSPNGKALQKQKEQSNIQSQPLFQRLLRFNFYKRSKCSCDSNLKESETCNKALQWILKKYNKSEFEYLKMTYEKILSENKLQNPEIFKQIQKDTNRTYPTSTYFAPGSEG